MHIIVALKVVLDDQDILVNADRSLDTSRAHQIASLYDLNALEAAVQLAATQEGSRVTVVSVGSSQIDDSKLRKNILARGADELVMLADDEAAQWGSVETARALAALIAELEPFDLIVCGDGSADTFAQQVDVQLATVLEVPVFNAVAGWELSDTSALCLRRVLEDVEQTIECRLPLVASVMPDIALPRICGMKEILAAGKKPVRLRTAADLGLANGPIAKLELGETKAPEQQARSARIYETASPEGLKDFCAAFAEIVN